MHRCIAAALSLIAYSYSLQITNPGGQEVDVTTLSVHRAYATCHEACYADGCECQSCSSKFSYSCDGCCCVCDSRRTCPSTVGDTIYAWCSAKAGGALDTISLPWANGKRIAVLIRGEIFRRIDDDRVDKRSSAAVDTVYKACSRSHTATEAQKAASTSLVQNFVEPLEYFGSTIHLFVTASTCDRIYEVVHILGTRRVRNVTMFDTTDQLESLRKAMDSFKQLSGGAVAVKANYDLFVLTRHDLFFPAHTFAQVTLADFEKFNFLAPCYEEMKFFDDYDECRQDAFYMMPSHWFPALNHAIGLPDSCCFEPHDSMHWYGPHDHMCTTSGHFCLGALQNKSIAGFESDAESFGTIFKQPLHIPVV